MKRSSGLFVGMLLLVMNSGQDVLAQQDQARTDQPRMKQALQQRLAKLREQEQQLEEALEKLAAGADPRELREQLQRFDRQGASRLGEQQEKTPGNGADSEEFSRAHQQVTDEELIEVLRLLDSPMADRIAGALERNPQRARQQLRKMAYRLRELVVLKRENSDAFRPRVEMHKAGRDAFRAARRLYHLTQGDAGQAVIEETKAAVLDAIRRRVDAEIEFREAMLTRFTGRLDMMRDEIGNLRASRQERIIEQMDHLLDRIARGKAPDAEVLEGSPYR